MVREFAAELEEAQVDGTKILATAKSASPR